LTPERFLIVWTTDLSGPLGLGRQSRNYFHCVGTVRLDFDDRVRPIEMPAERPTIRRLPDQDCARRQSLEIATANSDLTVGFLRGIHLPRDRKSTRLNSSHR